MHNDKTNQDKDPRNGGDTAAIKNTKLDKLKFEVGQEMGIMTKQKYKK